MKKLVALLLVAVLLVGISVGCSQNASTNEKHGEVDDTKTYTLLVGNVLADDDPITIGLRQMSDKVNERTNGKVIIEVYPSSQLGDTADVLEQAKTGTNVGIIIDTGMLADYVPDMAIYTAPYIFDGVDEARAFIETDVFKNWDEELSGHGLRDLSCNWYQGARHFLTKKPVRVPEDLKGLRVRTMGSKVAQETMKALGAVPTSVAWSEAYSALQQKVVDSVEAQLPAVYGSSLHEVVDYISETGHFLLYTALIVSENWFQSLPEEYQQILIEESIANGDYATELTIEKEEEYKKEMEAAGVEFIQVDKTPFKEATEKVYDIMGWTELKEQIYKELGK